MGLGIQRSSSAPGGKIKELLFWETKGHLRERGEFDLDYSF